MATRNTTTTVANLKDLPKRLSNPLYIGRGSFWGNPFVIGKDGDRDAVLAKFRKHLWNRKDMLRKLPELKGKTLLCFCSPEKCHGHVLVAALDWYEGEVKKHRPLTQPIASKTEIAEFRRRNLAAAGKGPTADQQKDQLLAAGFPLND